MENPQGANTELVATQAFLTKLNAMNDIFGGDQKVLPTTFEESKFIFKSLSSQLSPEMLHADGERSASEVAQRSAMLNEVWEELEEKFDVTVNDTDEWRWT